MLRAVARSFNVVARQAQVVQRVAVRAASTEADDSLIMPAARLFGVDGRYAHALYSAAFKGKALEKVEEEIHFVRDVVLKQPGFRQVLEDPAVSRNTKRDQLMGALRDLKLSDMTTNFMGLLAENGRTREINAVIGAFDRLMDSHRGIVNATVVHADELTPAVESAAKSIITRMVPAGTQPKISYQRDETILGGVVVRVADSVVDQSVKTELELMWDHLDRDPTSEEVDRLRARK